MTVKVLSSFYLVSCDQLRVVVDPLNPCFDTHVPRGAWTQCVLLYNCVCVWVCLSVRTHRDLEYIDLPVYAAKAHDGIVNTIDACGGLGIGGGAPEIVTGGRDGECSATID